METEILAGVLQADTHKRLQIAEQLIEHFKKEDVFKDFSDIERLVGGLSSWIGSSNFKVCTLHIVLRPNMFKMCCMQPRPVCHCSPFQVSVSGMQIMEVIVASLKASFRPYIPTSKLELQHSLDNCGSVL